MSLVKTAPFDPTGYQQVCKLGKGHSGEVSLYFHFATSTLRAVKFASHREDDAANFREFRREILAYESCHSQAIVKCLNYGIPKSLSPAPFLELEFLPGGTLVDYIECYSEYSGLNLNVAFRILLGVARAVGDLHATGITHRDIKPENVLLDRNLHPYLADFGFARSIDAATSLSIVGTPNYMAPEMLTGEVYTNAVDVWGFGMLMYTLCIKKIPYHEQADGCPGDAEFRQAVVNAIKRGVKPRWDDGVPLFGPLFEMCTDQNPAKRPTMEKCIKKILNLALKNREALLGFDYEAVRRYHEELVSGKEREQRGTLKDLEAAMGKSRLAAAVYGIMLYEGIGVETSVDNGISWLLKADLQGSDLARAKLREVEMETGEDFHLTDRPVQPLHVSSLFVANFETRPAI